MSWFSRRRQSQQDLDEEIQAHLDLEADARTDAGASAEEARRAARRAFGNIGLAKEDARAAWGLAGLEAAWQDLRYAARGLVRDRRFMAVATLSLALGIGANTAIFSLIRTVILRDLPVEHPESLVELVQQYPGDPRLNLYGLDAFEHMRDNTRTLESLIAASAQNRERTLIRLDRGEPERADVEFVSGDYFRVLGIEPFIGRLLGPDDDSASGTASPAAVISWRLWQARFEGSASAIGRRVVVEDRPMTIAGVAPPGFFGVEVGFEPEIWASLAVEGAMHEEGRRVGVRLLGRLKPNETLAGAQAELGVLFRQTLNPDRMRDDPLLRRLSFEVEPAAAGVGRLRSQFKKPLLFLMAVTTLLLLIACTNVASMLLARGAARERELAVRVSLGAGRARLAAMALTESLLLALLGSLAGAGMAYGLSSSLVRIITTGRRVVELEVNPDLGVLLFTATAATLTAVLFGAGPALRAMRATARPSLQTAGRASASRTVGAVRKTLVAAQVALSVLLLSAAGLFLGHLADLRGGLGFDRERLLLVTLGVPERGNDTALAQPMRQLLDRLEAIPGVRSAALSGVSPLSGAGANRFATVEGFEERPGQRHWIALNWISPRYFETLGTPLLAGRDFSFHEAAGSRPLIINAAMAHYYFGDSDALGKRVTFDNQTQPYEIVGVVGDAKYLEAGETVPHTAYHHAFVEPQLFERQLTLRTSLDPASVAEVARRAIRETLPDRSVDKVITMASQVDETIVPERLAATLAGAFGALGGLLATAGLYGLLGYMVAMRAGEIGIRAALGATAADSILLVFKEAALVVACGLAVGAPLAWLAKGLAGQVFAGLESPPAAPLALAAACVLLLVVPAACAPAVRAARIDPMEALRRE